MEVSESIGKNESFPAYQKPVNNPLVFYNNYFDDQINVKALGKEKKSRDRESLKNGKLPSRSSKINESKSSLLNTKQSNPGCDFPRSEYINGNSSIVV